MTTQEKLQKIANKYNHFKPAHYCPEKLPKSTADLPEQSDLDKFLKEIHQTLRKDNCNTCAVILTDMHKTEHKLLKATFAITYIKEWHLHSLVLRLTSKPYQTTSTKEILQNLLQELTEETNGFMKDIPDGDYLRGNINFSVLARNLVQKHIDNLTERN